MWAEKVNFVSKMTPKSRSSETRSRTDPPMEYGCTTEDVFRLSVKVKHFDAFRRSFQSADHLLRLSRSDCSCSQSDVVRTRWYSLTSSANMMHWDDFTAMGRSLMYSANKRGANKAPSGTPDVTSRHSEDFPFTTTFCSLSDRYEPNQSRILPDTWYEFCSL